MAKTYADFMAVGDVKKMKCGEKSLDVEKTLTKAFKGSRKGDKEAEKEQFAKIVSTAMQTQIGRDTLTELAKLGYKFAFETGEFGGFCDPAKKRIVLNPTNDFDYQLPVMVHEATHALQHERDKSGLSEKDMEVASMLKKNRAIEADATAHEMAFLCQLKEVYPAPYEAEKKRGLPMLTAYEDAKAKTGDEDKALNAAFKSWYDCAEYRDFYDHWFTPWVGGISEEGIDNDDPSRFAHALKNKDVLALCLNKGKPYVEAEFLDSDKAFSVSKSDRESIIEWTKDYADEVYGAKRDRSVYKMAVRDETGKIIAPAKTKAASPAVKAKIADKAKGR